MDLKFAIETLRRTKTPFATQAELAAAAGIDEGNLSRFMRGKQNLSRPKLHSLARALNSAVWEIYALAELKEENRKRAVLMLVSTMSDEDAAAFLRLFRPESQKLPALPPPNAGTA